MGHFLGYTLGRKREKRVREKKVERSIKWIWKVNKIIPYSEIFLRPKNFANFAVLGSSVKILSSKI